MSGIIGVLNVDGAGVDSGLLARMVQTLRDRDAAGSGVWLRGPVGLGGRTSASSTESESPQLILSRDGSLCLTADARIDNREELKKELEPRGFCLDEKSDAEVILRSYQAWGSECPRKLRGDFAFALWDGRRKRLFCARDPIGIKPFYYNFNGKRFAFASSLASLLHASRLSRRPNAQLMASYLRGCAGASRETLYQQIQRLPAAHSLSVVDGRVWTQRYWEIDPQNSVHYRSLDDYAQHFQELFRDSVRVRLRGGPAVGAWLSGGLDSSSIVATAGALVKEGLAPPPGLETFSMLFDGYPCDESAYIGEVARLWGQSNPFTYEPSWVDFDRVREHPSALYSPTLFSNIPLLQKARSKHVRVLLDGVGGDELLEVDSDASQRATVPPWRRMISALPASAQSLLRRTRNRLRPDPTSAWLRPAALDWARAEEIVEEKKFSCPRKQRISDSLSKGWSVNVALPMADSLRRAYGIETRYPFFDLRLVEYVLALPIDCWSVQAGPKPILRRAMRGLLPPAVCNRSGKANFSCLIDAELQSRQASQVESLLRDSSLAALGLIEPGPLRQLYQRYRNAPTPDASERRSLQLVVALELWCKANEKTPHHSNGGSRRAPRVRAAGPAIALGGGSHPGCIGRMSP